MKEEIATGKFTQVLCCAECDWFYIPVYFRGLELPQLIQVCPGCGGEINEMIGQYKSRKTKRWFDFEWQYEIIDFIRKTQQEEIYDEKNNQRA